MRARHHAIIAPDSNWSPDLTSPITPDGKAVVAVVPSQSTKIRAVETRAWDVAPVQVDSHFASWMPGAREFVFLGHEGDARVAPSDSTRAGRSAFSQCLKVAEEHMCEHEAERHEWRAEVLEFLRDRIAYTSDCGEAIST
jgi:hypothetical protein